MRTSTKNSAITKIFNINSRVNIINIIMSTLERQCNFDTMIPTAVNLLSLWFRMPRLVDGTSRTKKIGNMDDQYRDCARIVKKYPASIYIHTYSSRCPKVWTFVKTPGNISDTLIVDGCCGRAIRGTKFALVFFAIVVNYRVEWDEITNLIRLPDIWPGGNRIGSKIRNGPNSI